MFASVDDLGILFFNSPQQFKAFWRRLDGAQKRHCHPVFNGKRSNSPSSGQTRLPRSEPMRLGTPKHPV